MLLQVVALGMVAVIQAVAGSEPKQEVVRAIQHSGTAAQILGAVAVVVFAPVAEELLFRGLLLRGLLRRFARAGRGAARRASPSPWSTSLDPSTAPLLAPLALVGVLSGILAVRTGDLSRSILLHAGFNLLSAVLLLADLSPRRRSQAADLRKRAPHPSNHPCSSTDHPPENSPEPSTSESHGKPDRPDPGQEERPDAVQPMRQAGNGRDPDEDRR